jgi:hypothetical protein
MHGLLTNRHRKRSSLAENVLILLGVVIAVEAVRVADNHGVPQKWHAAVLGTLVPFLSMVWFYRMRWSRWSFWASLSICLAVHVAATWIFFQYVLLNVQHVALLVCYPIVLIEVFVLAVVVQRLDDKFAGRVRRPSPRPD